jgi:hypothetical protein
MYEIGDADLIAEAPQLISVGSFADDKQMNVFANDFQQVGGPNGVFHPIPQ